MTSLANAPHFAAVRISELSNEELADVPVTFYDAQPASRFRDDVWDFGAHIDRQNNYPREARIVWSRPLPNGVVLTDGLHDALLLEMKRAMLSFATCERPSIGRAPKANTVFHSNWVSVRRFCAFLTSRKLRSLSEVGPQHYRAYYEEIREATCIAGPNMGKRLAPSTMYSYGVITNSLWSARIDIRLPAMLEPWPELRLRQYFGFRKRYESATAIIPDAAIKSALAFAFDLIEDRLARAVEVNRIIEDIYILNEGKAGVICRKARAVFHKFGYTDGNAFRKELHLCRAACIVVILFFSGIRESELTSLQRGCYRSRTLADTPRHGVLTGLRYKGLEIPEVFNLVVPSVVGTAVRALHVLVDSISANNIKKSKRSFGPNAIEPGGTGFDARRSVGALLVTRSQKKRNGPLTRMTGHLIRWDLQLFSKSAGCLDDDGKPWILSCHQFRRTFAYMMARHELGDVRYLSHHFGHTEISMTVYYCSGPMSDASLACEVKNERARIQGAIVSGWLSPKTPLGGGKGREITSKRIAIKTVAARRDLSSVISDGLRIRGTGHSFCTYQGDGCGGLGLFDAIRCARCSGAVITPEHLPVWESLREQQREILASGELGVGLLERAKEHLGECDLVIADLRRASA